MIDIRVAEATRCNGDWSLYVTFPYDQKIVDVIRTYPNRFWNKDKKEWEIPFTIHSGECGSVDNIREAIALGAKRLGHGIALKKSPELRQLCKEKGIGIEMCPTSNLQTKAVEDFNSYPLKQFLEEGLLVSVHTDNRTVSGTTMEQEEKLVKERLQISDEMWLQCTKNAILTAFASDEIKERLMEELLKVRL